MVLRSIDRIKTIKRRIALGVVAAGIMVGSFATSGHVTAAQTSPEIRVALLTDQKHVRVTAIGDFKLVNRAPLGGTINKASSLELFDLYPYTNSEAQGVYVEDYGAFGRTVEISARDGSGAKPLIRGRTYRGAVEVTLNEQGRLDVINVLNLEEYLYGVLRNEMSVDWPMEALKSQAVAARTYAVYKAMQNQNRPYDLVDHEVDQVYNGFDTEHDRIRQAVDATRGEILIYQGEPVEAFYSSQSGDYTANSENIWGNYVPYLRSVSSPFEADAPYYRWEISLTYEELAAHLNRDWRLKIGLIYDLEIRRSPQSRRVTHVWIHHSNGRETVLTGVEFKNLARLPSTLFTVTRNEYGVTFAGSGRGHGLGLSQWGARGYALNGYNYRAILQHYYPGVEIVKLRETEILARR